MSEILIVDDDQKTQEMLNANFKRLGYNLTFASNGKEAFQILEKFIPDCAICCLKLNDTSGIKILEKIKEINNHIQVILISDYYEVSDVIRAMEKGAFDFLTKPFDFEQIKFKIDKALEILSISLRLSEYLDFDSKEYNLDNNLIGNTCQMRLISKNICQLSANKVTVFIHGEIGTGKELVAKLIHFNGKYKEQPFISVNCSAMSEDLLERELFGYVSGAFIGAERDQKGKFELSRDGTIFFDEISELSLRLQSKLLKVIQQREIKKIGGETLLPMNARIFFASNQNLEELVENGKFMHDLYIRLKLFTLDIPPLRERKEDIPLLVTHILRKINYELHKNVNKIPIEIMDLLKQYNWPGNVRELENVLLQAVVLSTNDAISKENIKFQINEVNRCDDTGITLEELEKRHILKVLKSVNWNKNKATTILGISKPTLYSKVEKYKLTKNLK